MLGIKEELPFPLHLWLLSPARQWLGSYNDWFAGAAFQRWLCGHDLDVPHSHRRPSVFDTVDG